MTQDNKTTSNKQKISQRKKDHLKIALSNNTQIGNPGFSNYRFVHNALPEINFDQIDTKTSFLGKKVNLPFL
jgi:isopentenyl-diphosphate delta-isomerase